MIAFNTNFHFINEIAISSTINPKIDTIHVLEKINLISDFSYPIKSPWIIMSGKKVRYCSYRYFDELISIDNWALEIKETIVLSWDSKQRKIYYQRGRLYSKDILIFWIFHTFYPLIMELEKSYKMLHVGSVEVNNKTILFSAPSFGGKSTLTNYFIEQNHTLLSDDSLAIEEKKDIYYAIPSYPFNRPYRELETLGKPVKNFATEPKPIQCMYLLEKGLASENILVVPLHGIEKYKAFHSSNFIDFYFMKKERFLFFTKMSKKIPVYKIKIPWTLTRLDDVYQAILRHIKQQS